ncbi:unnamed protein product [Thlaspi arvense]|uniref:Uncharacterized protein n=1 Tax=Thlaspi arvense TaxID=13288 RepID=A0AAU9S3Q5_THLAR|nr:unnamed protein product [Thlaspi arvense]
MVPPVIYKYRRRRDPRVLRDDDGSLMRNPPRVSPSHSIDRPNSDFIEVRDVNPLLSEDGDRIRDLGCVEDETETRRGSGNLVLHCDGDCLDKDKCSSFVSCSNLDDLFSGFVYRGVRKTRSRLGS